MTTRQILLVLLILCRVGLYAQTWTPSRYLLHATVYCQRTQVPLEGVLLKVTDKSGHTDSLFTDTLGVARSASGSDSLLLPSTSGSEFNIEVEWSMGSVQLRDKVTIMDFSGATVFVKEYFLRNCADPIDDHRWLPPSVYFPTNSALPLNDTAWYRQEAQVGNADEAIRAVVEMMKDNPTLVVRTIGYCDAHEKDCTRLALARANCVRNMLIKHGIPAERVEAKGRAGAQRYTEAEIAGMKDQKQREIALARDRHVGYLAISFDYKP